MNKQYEIHYNEEQLSAAAKVIFENNPHCAYWPTPCFSASGVRQHIMDAITDHGHRCVNVLRHSRDVNADWPWMTGTGGYYLIFTNDDGSNIITVDILVDPAINKGHQRYIVDYVETED